MIVIAFDRTRDLDFHLDTEDQIPWGRADSTGDGYVGLRMADVLPIFTDLVKTECAYGKHCATFPVNLQCCDTWACFECASQNLLGNDFRCYCGAPVLMGDLEMPALSGAFDYRVKCPFSCGVYFVWGTRAAREHLSACQVNVPRVDIQARVDLLTALEAETTPRQPLYLAPVPERQTHRVKLNVEEAGVLGSLTAVTSKSAHRIPGPKYYPIRVQPSPQNMTEVSMDDSVSLTFDVDQPPSRSSKAVSSLRNKDKTGAPSRAGRPVKSKATRGKGKRGTTTTEKTSKGRRKVGRPKKADRVKGGVSKSKKEAEKSRLARIAHRRSLSALARQRKAQAEKDKGPLIPDLPINEDTLYLVGSQVNRVLGLNRGILYIKHPRLWHRKATLQEKRYLARINAISTSCVKANLVRALEVDLVVERHHPELRADIKALKRFKLETTKELMMAPTD